MLETAESIIRSELAADERLLWADQPRRGIAFRKHDILLIPFSLVWGGFAIAWETLVLFMFITSLEKGPWGIAVIFPLFGIPFVLAGLYMIFGRFIVDSKVRGKTFYGLTDQRVIIVSGLFSREIKSLQLRTLSDISLTEKSDKSGTITLGPSHPMAWWYGAMPGWSGMAKAAPALEMIPAAKDVYRQIQEAQSKVLA